MKQLICRETDAFNLGTVSSVPPPRCGPQIYVLSLSVRRVPFLRLVVLLSLISRPPYSGRRLMSPTSPTRDSHSPPVPISPDTPSSLPYTSRPERNPNSRGAPSVDPSSAATPVLPSTSLPARRPSQQQAEAGASHAPSSPSAPATPQRRPSQDRRMHSPSSSSQGDAADTEVESGPSSGQPAGQNQLHDPPQKKKRTRTLTTPHQSAVLHALLAQVRPLSIILSIPINTLF